MPYNEKSKEATMRYLSKLRQLNIRVKPEEYERIESAAHAMGYTSMRKFYLDAINEKIERFNNLS